MRRVLNQNYFFINKTNVLMLLQTNGDADNLTKVSSDLGWGETALRDYLSYESKIPRKRVNELANYFGIKYPSRLINYQPTKAIKEKYGRNKARRIAQRKRQIPLKLDSDTSKKSVVNDTQDSSDLTKEVQSLAKLVIRLNEKIDKQSKEYEQKIEGLKGDLAPIKEIERKVNGMALDRHFNGR